MKKLLTISVICFGLSITSSAQLQFGIKAGINYNSDSFKNVSNDVLEGAKSKTGYHAGIWFRAKLPVIGLYLRPELVYTNLGNEVNYTSNNIKKPTDYSFQKIDVPVLLGKKILKIGNIFIGPSFQYILDSDFSTNTLTIDSMDKFSVGLQFGVGIEIDNLGIDARWERAFSDAETRFLDGVNPSTFDTRVNQIIFGLSYKF